MSKTRAEAADANAIEEVYARVWTSGFPEHDVPGIIARPNAALCLSGGGNRALTTAMGALRGLHALGLMSRFRYISAVSGGAWATSIYAFCPPERASDADLLGRIQPPEAVTRSALSAPLPDKRLASPATADVRSFLLSNLSCCPLDRLWERAIEERLLAPFGLHCADSRNRTITLDEQTRDAIIARQGPGGALHPDDFLLCRPERPFPVINASLLGPSAALPLAREVPTLWQTTPLYSGSAHLLEQTWQPRMGHAFTSAVGGGFIEPFAVNGAVCQMLRGTGVYRVRRPGPLPTLCFSVGASSAAFAGVTDELPYATAFSPRLDLWPVVCGSMPTPITCSVGDGGVLENYGLITMLQRRVERLVVLISTDTPLRLAYDPETPPRAADLDEYLPALFGYPSGGVGVMLSNNRVFARADFARVVRALQAARRAGRPVLTLQRHMVQSNGWWGVRGGFEVEICWVYLERAAQWETRFRDPGIRRDLDHSARMLGAGPLARFPHYSTIGAESGLTPYQIRMLADLVCWMVTDEADTFRDLLGVG